MIYAKPPDKVFDGSAVGGNNVCVQTKQNFLLLSKRKQPFDAHFQTRAKLTFSLTDVLVLIKIIARKE